MTEKEEAMCERLKEIRNALKMKQGDFAAEIKTTQGHVSDIENKRKGVSDRVVEIICLKFDVNEDWLRTGSGEMFVERTKSEQISEMISDVLESDEENFKRRLISALAKLDNDGWQKLEELINEIAKK